MLRQTIAIMRRTHASRWCRMASSSRSAAEATETENTYSKYLNDEPPASSSTLGVTSAQKLKAPPPLAKNFFMGTIDRVLASPSEIVSRAEMATLQQELAPLTELFANKQLEAEIDAAGRVPEALLMQLRQLGVYGLNAPTQHGGRDYGWTKSLIATTPESECPSVASLLLPHRVVIDVLKEFGTAEQLQRYGAQLASGTLITTDAIHEYEPAAERLFATNAIFCGEDRSWLLNGEKAYVVAGPLPSGARQLFLVVADTGETNVPDLGGRSTTFLLVESDQPGVTIGERLPTMGCRGVEQRRVSFKDVKVAETNVFGHPENGHICAESLLRSWRFRSTLIGFTLAKNMMNELTAFCRKSITPQLGLDKLEYLRCAVARALCGVYSIESMLYYTAGLMDEFDKPDVNLEVAMTKYHTMNELNKLAETMRGILGPDCLLDGQPMQLFTRNVGHYHTQGETSLVLSQYIGLLGLQHSGVELRDVIFKQRNPLFHPVSVWGKHFSSQSVEDVYVDMKLSDELHPMLAMNSRSIEQAVSRLHMAVDMFLSRYGRDAVTRHNDVLRLADASTTIFTMWATTVRASHSYCSKNPLSDHELLASATIGQFGDIEVLRLCSDVINGVYMNNDNNLIRMSEKIISSKGYYPSHPTTYNF